MQNKIYFYIGIALGIIFTSLCSYFIFIRPSFDRDTEYRKQQSELESRNRELIEADRITRENLLGLENKLRDRESEYNRLYSQSEESIARQRAIIDKAGKVISSTTDSIQRLKTIIGLFKEIEQGIGY